MHKTSIEWCDMTCNPFRARGQDDRMGWHCVKLSSGCAHCFSERIDHRLGTHTPFTAAGTKKVQLELDTRPLERLAKVKTPQRVFMCDMTDMFLEDYPDEWIDTVWRYMHKASWHTFLVLTKRIERARDYTKARWRADQKNPVWHPIPNIGLGTSVENQQTANQRVGPLLQAEAAFRFVSAEPLLGRIQFRNLWDIPDSDEDVRLDALEGIYWCGKYDEIGTKDRRIDWMIVGGESGPGARPMHPDWVRSIRDQCVAAGVSFYFKQHGEWLPVSHPHDADEVVFAANTYFPRGRWLDIDGSDKHRTWATVMVDRVGKKAAGRLLDGRTWDEYPKLADPGVVPPTEPRREDYPGQQLLF